MGKPKSPEPITPETLGDQPVRVMISAVPQVRDQFSHIATVVIGPLDADPRACVRVMVLFEVAAASVHVVSPCGFGTVIPLRGAVVAVAEHLVRGHAEDTAGPEPGCAVH